jgi:hypothetical protein
MMGKDLRTFDIVNVLTTMTMLAAITDSKQRMLKPRITLIFPFFSDVEGRRKFTIMPQCLVRFRREMILITYT